jgi:hypothetical protein
MKSLEILCREKLGMIDEGRRTIFALRVIQKLQGKSFGSIEFDICFNILAEHLSPSIRNMIRSETPHGSFHIDETKKKEVSCFIQEFDIEEQ